MRGTPSSQRVVNITPPMFSDIPPPTDEVERAAERRLKDLAAVGVEPYSVRYLNRGGIVIRYHLLDERISAFYYNRDGGIAKDVLG